MQVNVQFLQQHQPEWSRFVTVVKQTSDLYTISYRKLFEILKQYQNKVNEIRAERISMNANPLALVVATQHYPDNYPRAPNRYKTQALSQRQTTSIRSHATTISKGKEIVKEPSPHLRLGHFSKECGSAKRVKDYAYHKENMLMCKKEDVGIQLSAEQKVLPAADEDNRPTYDTETLEIKSDFKVLQGNINNIKLVVEDKWKQRLDNRRRQDIINDIKVLVNELLIPLAQRTFTNAANFEKALKDEMGEDFKYAQSLEKEVDDLKSQLERK
ncbi:hypothetical protein Tco_0304000 [Tanacetum coccineum]